MTTKAPGMFRSLRSFNYRVWAAGAFVSNIGTWMQRTAQTWLVLMQLTQHNASAVGLVMALQYGPQLLLLPLTGYVADHFNQRRLLIMTQATMGAFALILGVLTVTGVVELWQVDAFAFLFGCAAAFDAPVRQTFVAELVGDNDLPNAIALNSTSFNSARMIGPAIAGVVIAAFGTGWAFLINGASFAAVLMSLTLLRTADLRPNARANRVKGDFLGSVTGGFRYVWSRPDLKAVLIMLALIGTFGLNFQIFVSTMAIKVFQSDARGYGLLSSVMAIGTVAGALFNATQHRPRFGALRAGAALFGIGCTLAALAPTIWLFGAALAVVGVAALMFTNTTNSLMQLATEPAMRGRVMALRVGVALGGTPIGAPIVGWV
ncbi:MAG: MFS transporter, partial [Bradyrhizobium sp.]|uniref:MFS transporter n=1 Tax=Bradyrhizobium sp. TaxID=376 RepID=UPI003C7E64AE